MKLRFDRRIGVALLLRIALFATLWWMVTEGAMNGWLLGAPAVLISSIISIMLIPPVTLVWSELLRFIPFFLVRSLQGGVDVAWRALHPSLPIAPTMADYTLRLPPGLPRVVMINTISLLPGTLSVDVIENRLTVHLLDGTKNHFVELEKVENRVAHLFAIPLPASERGN